MHKSTRENAIILVALLLIFSPFLALAQIEITEIMADPEGADEGREWIKILNRSASAIDLTSWTFYENETNHRLSGDLILEAGETAIIADNIENYKLDYPGYQGKLIDSSFSLKNSGEYLALKDASGNIVYETNYSDSSVEPEPTPQDLEPAPESSSPPLKISLADAGADMVSADLTIQFDGSKSIGEKYLWNFGDGQTSPGISPLHVYAFPGEYIATLQVDDSVDSILITIFPNDIFISEFYPQKSWLEIYSGSTINLAGWQINDFVFPANSLIKADQYLTIPMAIENPLQFKYPHGEIMQEIGFSENDYAVTLAGGIYVYTNIPTPGAPNLAIINSQSEALNPRPITETEMPNLKLNSDLKTQASNSQLPTSQSELSVFGKIKTEPTLLTAGIGLLVNKLVIPFALVMLLGLLIGYAIKR